MSKATTAQRGGKIMSICSVALAAVAPVILPKPILVVVFIIAAVGFVIGIVLSIYGRRAVVREQKKQETKSLAIRKENKEINDILDVVEAMDNCLYRLLPRVEKRHLLTHPNLNKTVGDAIKSLGDICRIWLWFHPYIFWTDIQKGGVQLSEFMDEKHLGLEQCTKDKTYSNLESRLTQMIRLKTIDFRNAVYGFLKFSYGFNSELLYFNILKKTVGRLPLPTAMIIRRLNNIRGQVVGNALTVLALKLEEYAGNE
jgi:hypothetical protein